MSISLVRRFGLVSFIFVFSAIFLSAHAVIAGTETRLTYDSSDTSNIHPSISGNKIVWVNLGGRGVAMYDLASGTQTQLSREHNSSESYSYPFISNDRAVWVESIGSSYTDIMMYDLANHLKTKITTNSTSSKYGPVISGDKIVWVDYRSGKPDVYMYNLSMQTETQISTSGAAGSVYISGNKIVWQDHRNNDWWTGNDDIYMYDLATHIETQITSDVADQGNPVISGDKIVWFDSNWRNGNFINLYTHNLITGTGKYIATHIGRGGTPSPIGISGDRVVWTDERNGNWDYNIYMYDLSAGIETQITTNPTNQIYPSISGDKIVWSDYRSVNSNGQNRWDIYLYDLNPNVAPNPQISPVPTITLGQSASFDGSSSSDSDGTIANYHWDFGDGATDEGANVNHVYASAGTHTVTLTVTDDDGATATETASVLVNTPPVATIAPVPTTLFGTAITFDGSRSLDSDGTLASYIWDFGDSSTGSGTTALHTYTTSGTYVVTLTVTDDQGAMGTATISVRINVAPITAIAPVQTVILGEVSHFDGSGSYDADGSIMSFVWNFGDGTVSTGVLTSHKYLTAGTYQATLTVTDNDGATGVASLQVIVQSQVQAISGLMDLVESMNLAQGISNSLDSKLQNASDALEAMNAGSMNSAISKLQAFVNACQAQSGNQLTIAQADQLITEVNRIIAAIQ